MGGNVPPPAEPVHLFGQALKEIVERRAMTADADLRKYFTYLQTTLEQSERLGQEVFLAQLESFVAQALKTTSERTTCEEAFRAVGSRRSRLEQLHVSFRMMSEAAGAFADEVHDLYLAAWAKEVGSVEHSRLSAATIHALRPTSA